MAFSKSSRNLRLEGLVLYAECQNIIGSWRSSKINLSRYLRCDDGELSWREHAILMSVPVTEGTYYTLNGSRLLACPASKNGPASKNSPQISSLELDDRIANSNGRLLYDKFAPARKESIDATLEHQVRLDWYFRGCAAFMFQPLSTTRSIRLVTFEVGDGDVLEGTLTEYNLATAPPYIALSYTWGDPDAVYPPRNWCNDRSHNCSRLPIQCNGKVMRIGLNLYHAIKDCMRPPKKEHRERIYNKTLLIRQAESGDIRSVLELLSTGADVMARDSFGETALHYAAENGHLDVVKALVFAGSPIGQFDQLGRKPIDCARQRSRGSWQGVVAFLIACASRKSLTNPAGSRTKRSATQHYWIDSLCIDQSNEAEKTSQVALMGEIYRQAEDVIAYLGPDASIASQSRRKMARDCWRLEEARYMGILTEEILYAIVRDPIHSELEERDSPLRSIADSWLLSEVSENPYSPLAVLFEKDWFERAWVLQEIMLARRIVVFSGHYQVSWETFVFMACIIYWARHWRFRQVLEGASIVRFPKRSAVHAISRPLRHRQLYRALRLARLRIAYHLYGKLSMINALALSRHAHCSEPRDKVFSLVSITDFVSLDGRPLTLSYEQSMQEVYIEVSRAVFAIEGLRSLSICGNEQALFGQSVPSWVLNLQGEHLHPPTTLTMFSDSGDGLYAHHSISWSFMSSQQLLTASLRFDVVAFVGQPKLRFGWLNSAPDSLLVILDALCCIEVESPVAQLCKVFQGGIQNTKNVSQDGSKSLYEDFVCWLRYSIVFDICDSLDNEIFTALPELEHGELTLYPEHLVDVEYEVHGRSRRRSDMAAARRFFRRVGISFPDEPHCEVNSEQDLLYYHKLWTDNLVGAANFASYSMHLNWGSSLFRTENSSLLGSGPETMKLGDVVCYLPENTRPFILRERRGDTREGEYVLLGEANLPGRLDKHGDFDKKLERFLGSGGTVSGEQIRIV